MTGQASRAAFDEVLALDAQSGTLTVALASSAKEAILPRWQRLQLAETLVGDFRQIVAYLIAQLKHERDSGHLLLHAYCLQSRPEPHEVEWLALSDHGDIAGQLRPLASPVSLDLFEEEAAFVAGLRFYAITLRSAEGSSVHFLRAYSQKKVLGRSHFLSAWLQDGVYDRVSTPVFLFDHHIDAVAVGEWLFLLQKEHVHEMFRIAQALRQCAGDMLAALRARVPIANFEAFARDCEGHLVKLAKLRSILSKDYLRLLTMGRIQQVIAAYHLPLEIIQEDGCAQLRYDPRQKWVILKLLDDDFLWSALSEQRYEVSGKRELKKEGPLDV